MMLEEGGVSQVDGVLIINKPAGMTSHDVVAQVRRILGEKSVGHLGTLDPSATGVLPLVVGRFTRLAQFFVESDKRYEGIIRFGFATDTYDADGEAAGPPQPVNLTLEQILEAAKKFVGTLDQVPPAFSAKKIDGVPAYKLARKKQEVELKPKQVEVKEFEITAWDGERARFRCWVSSGTYVRSIAHDLGKGLGPGAHLAELTRTAVREFKLEDAHTLKEAKDSMSDNEYYVNNDEDRDNTGPARLFLHPRMILPEFRAVTAPPESLMKIRHGGAVNLPEFSKAPMVRVFEGQARLVCLARRVAGTLFQPKVVLI
jgi:tRNA pseudouridine55 synthase